MRVLNTLFAGGLLIWLAACFESISSGSAVKQFCSALQVGQPFADAESALPDRRLVMAGIAQPLSQEVVPNMPHESLRRIYGRVVMDRHGAVSDIGPACLIYYSDSLLGGDGSIVAKAYAEGYSGPSR